MVLSGFLLIEGKQFFLPLVFAFLLALLLNPIQTWISGWVKPGWLAIILAFIVVIIPVLVSFFLFGLQLKGALDDFSLITERLGEFVNESFRWVNSKFQFSQKEGMDFITEKVTNSIDQPIEMFASGLSESTGFFANLLLTFLFAFFFLLYKRGLKNFILQQTRKDKKETIRDMVKGIQNVTQHYLYGLLMVIVIVGLMNSIGLLIIGIDYAFFWGFLASFLAIIPYVGTAIGGFLPFVYALATMDSTWQPLAVVGLFATVQTVEGNLITPKIVGNSVQVNPFAAILALLIGQLIWGIAGMILALPVLAIVKVILDHVEITKPIGFLVGDKLADNPETLLEKWDEDKYKISSHLSKKRKDVL
jgi:predicted PurR-regulated permease PerM